MRMYKKFTFIVSLTVIVSLLYSNTVWALPNLGRETLGPLSSLVEEVARVDINASYLLSDVFHRFLASEGEVDLGILFEWINTSRNLHETLAVQKHGQKILILARGFNIEFSTAQLEGGKKLPRSDIWVRINYYTAGEIRYIDLAAVINQTDEEKDRLIDELAGYINSGADRGLVLLGNFFDVKGVFNALARRGISDDKLKKITTEGGMPNVYRRTLEHRYIDGDEIKTVPITVEEFSPFFERDRRRIEELEIEAWKAIGVAVKPEEIRERYYRNPIYIIREGERIAGGIATSWLDVGGEYERNIPKRYELLIEAHNPRGDTIFDFSVFTDLDPDVRKKKYGDILALATLEVAKLWGRREVIAASRAELFAGLVIKSSKFRHEISQLPKKEQFRAALKKIDEFLEALRRERGLPSDYSFTVEEIAGDIMDYFFNLKRGRPLVITERLAYRFTRYHLDTGDLFLDSFHHRLGARDVLEVLSSRPRDIRGLGANVYTSYHDTLKDAQLRCATPGDRAELERQIFGRYYELIQRRRKGFRGDIKSGIPGRLDSDPKEITEDPARTMEVSLREGTIGLEDENFARFIRGNFPGIDAGRIRDVICECFRKRKELFDPDGVNWNNLLARLRHRKQKGVKAHFILGSRSLFGNHSVDGVAWANLPAIQHLVSRIDDKQTAGMVLGIILGIGLSHEILGHEAGIVSDGVLTFQDAVLTLEMVKGHSYGFLEYINYLRLILEEDSPYIKQLKAIYTLTDPDRTADGEVLLLPPVTWIKGEKRAVAEEARIAGGAITEISLVIKYPAARPRGILLRKELDALSSSEQAPRYSRAVIKEPGMEGGSFKIFSYSREAEGHIEEIGSFNIKWIFGVPYIRFEFKKAYYHLMLSSRYAMAALVGSIVERFGLNIYRTQVLVEKPLLGVIPLKNGEEVVLIPVSEIGAEIEKPIDLNGLIIKQGIEERTVRTREVVKRQFYRWYTSNFTMAVIDSRVLPIGYMDGFMCNVFLALEKLLGLKTVSDEVKKRLLEKVSAVAFLPCSLGEECEFVFKSIGLDNGREQLSIAVNENSNVLKDPGDLDRLVYAFVRFLGSSEKKMNISFGEVEGIDRVEKPAYSTVYLSEDIILEFSSDGQIGRVWVKGNEVSSFLLEKLFPELRKTLTSLPANITLPAGLSYDVTKQLTGIRKPWVSKPGIPSYRYFRHRLNKSYLELYAHLGLYEKILDHGKESWDALEIILNLPDSIQRIDAFRQWLVGIDSIIFDQVKEGDNVTIDIKEEDNKKILIIKVPEGFKEGINQAYLISCILFYFYSQILDSRGIEFGRIRQDILDVITSRKGSEAKVLSIDAGNGLKVYVDKKGWVNAKFRDKDIPLILLEKLIPGFRRDILRLPKVRQFVGAAGFKFKGVPVSEDKAMEIVKRSNIAAADRGELDDVERQLQELARDNPVIKMPENIRGLIMVMAFKAKRTSLRDTGLEEGGRREEGLLREAIMARDYLYSDKQLPEEIPLQEILELFKALRRRNAVKVFTPRDEQDMGYFASSGDQHTTAILLREGEASACYLLSPIWSYLDSGLKTALVCHEMVEELLCSRGIPRLISHYIAEIVERVILGERIELTEDSILDNAIRGYFELPPEERRRRTQILPRRGHVAQLLGEMLNTFSHVLPEDLIRKTRGNFLLSPYIEVAELIKRLRDLRVKHALGMIEDDMVFLAELLEMAFLNPESQDIDIADFIGGFKGDKYRFAALLKLYIDSKTIPSGALGASVSDVSEATFLRVDPAKVGVAMAEANIHGIYSGEEIDVPIPKAEDGEEDLLDVHLTFLIQRFADIVTDAVDRRSGKRLNKKRLIKSIENIIFNMQTKDPLVVERFFENLAGLKIVFSPNAPGRDYLFKYKKPLGEVEINLDALVSIGNPDMIEILIAVGLFGDLLLGYGAGSVDVLSAWYEDLGADERRDRTPGGILTRQDVENTLHLLGPYNITPANLLHNLGRVSDPGERYIRGITGYVRTLERLTLNRLLEFYQMGSMERGAAVRRISRKEAEAVSRTRDGLALVRGYYYNTLAKAMGDEAFAQALTDAVMYSLIKAWRTGGEGLWATRWEIGEEELTFQIEYPVERTLELEDPELNELMGRLRAYFDTLRIEPGFDKEYRTTTEIIRLTKKIPRGPMGKGTETSSAKFKGVPVAEEEVRNIIVRADYNEMDEADLDDIEGLLVKIRERGRELKLPPNLGEIIYKGVLQLSTDADHLTGYIYAQEGRPETADVESDLAMSEKVGADIGLLFPGGSPSEIRSDGILWQEILEQFRAMRRNKAFKTFTPRRKRDLRYFLRSPNQHTVAVLLRAKVRKIYTSGTCFVLGPVWDYFGSINNKALRRRLRLALVLHEVIEELLYHRKIEINGVERDTPELVAHYIAEIGERIILGDDPYNLEKDSTLDVEIKNYFGGYHQRVLDSLSEDLPGAERGEEWIPPIIPGWIRERLIPTLKDFSREISRDVLDRARERCLPPYHIGIVELIKSLRDENVRTALGIGVMEASDLVGLLMNLFITPRSEELLEEFAGRFRDRYKFPALLKLYIDSKVTKMVRHETRPIPASGDFLAVDPASVEGILREKARVLRQPGRKRIVSLQGLGSSRERYDAHLHVLMRRIQNVIVEEVSNQTGIGLNREVLIKAIKNVLYSMQTKVPAIGEKLFMDLAGKRYLQIIFISDDPSAGYLFSYNKGTGEIKINMDALMAIDNPETIEILLAVGLIGNLLLGYSGDTINVLRAWYGYLGTGEKRDLTPEGILARQDVENTMYLLNQYNITPASLVYTMTKIVKPGERYPEGIVRYTRSLEQYLSADPSMPYRIGSKAIPEISRDIRKNLYGTEGSLVFSLPLGAIVETFYIMLAGAISEEILSLHLPPSIRVGFIDKFSQCLTSVLMSTVERAWRTRTEDEISWEDEWLIKWSIKDGKIIFSITYPVGEKKDASMRDFYGDVSYFDSVKLESGYSPLLGAPYESITLGKDMPAEECSLCGLIGKDISPQEVPDEDLTKVSEEELRGVIDNLEARYKIIEGDERFKDFISEIRKYINGIKNLAGQGKIFKFNAIVKGPEKFLLGFADKRGIALCNEFFEEGNPLNTVLDEALFHEAYHLRNMRQVNPEFVHEESRRMQELFFNDEVHYEPGAEPLDKRSSLRKYARELINKRCEEKVARPEAPPARPGFVEEEVLDYIEYTDTASPTEELIPSDRLNLLDANQLEMVNRAIDEIEERCKRKTSELGFVKSAPLLIPYAIRFLRELVKGERRTKRIYWFNAITDIEVATGRFIYNVAFQDHRGFAVSVEFLQGGAPLNKFLSQILFHLAYHLAGEEQWGKSPQVMHKEALAVERKLFEDEIHYRKVNERRMSILAEELEKFVTQRLVQEGKIIELTPGMRKPEFIALWEPEDPTNQIRMALIRDGLLRRMDIAITRSGKEPGKYYMWTRGFGDTPSQIITIGDFEVIQEDGIVDIQLNFLPGYSHFLGSPEIMGPIINSISENLGLDINSIRVLVPEPPVEAITIRSQGRSVRIPFERLVLLGEEAIVMPLEVIPVNEIEKVRVEEGVRGRRMAFPGYGDRLFVENFYYRSTDSFSLEIWNRFLEEKYVREICDTVLASMEAILNSNPERIGDDDLRQGLVDIKKSLLEAVDTIIFVPTQGRQNIFSWQLEEKTLGGKKKKVLIVYVNLSKGGTHNLLYVGLKGFMYMFLKFFINGGNRIDISFGEIKEAIEEISGGEIKPGANLQIKQLLTEIIRGEIPQEPRWITLHLGAKVSLEINNLGEIGKVLIGGKVVPSYFLERAIPGIRNSILGLPDVRRFLNPDAAVQGVLISPPVRITPGRIRLPERPLTPVTGRVPQRRPSEGAVTQIMDPDELLRIIGKREGPGPAPKAIALPERWGYGLSQWESTQERYRAIQAELNNKTFALEVEFGLRVDDEGLYEMWDDLNNVLNTTLNLPSSIQGVDDIRDRIVQNLDAVRFVPSEREVGDNLWIELKEDISGKVLEFHVPPGFIAKAGKDKGILFNAIVYFFYIDRRPRRNSLQVPVSYLEDIQSLEHNFVTLHRRVRHEISRWETEGEPIQIDLGDDLKAWANTHRVVMVQRQTDDIPQLLLERNIPGMVRHLVSIVREEIRRRSSPAPVSSPARIDIRPESPEHSELQIIPEYAQSSERVLYRAEPRGTVSDKEYWMVKRRLHNQEFILLVQGEYSDEQLAVELCNRVMTAIDAILNLPDNAEGIDQLKERIIKGFSTIRLDINPAGEDVRIEKKRQDIAGDILIFDLPFLDRRDLQEKMSVDNFIFSLLYFFVNERRTSLHFKVQALSNPPLYLGTVDPRLNTFYKWAMDAIARRRGYTGETINVRIPPPIDMEELRWLDVYVNRLGCVTAKLGDINIPLFLLERQNPGFRRKILRLSAGHRAFQARLREQYIEKGAPVEELTDVLEVGRNGELIKGKNFGRFCEFVDLPPKEVEEVLRIAFRYRTRIMRSEIQEAIQNLRFFLSGGYENPFGNDKGGDRIVTLNHYALREFPKDVRLIALAVGLSHEILGHEAGIDDEDILTAEDVDVTVFMIGQRLDLFLKYLSSLSRIIYEDESNYFRLLREGGRRAIDVTEDLVSNIADKIMARDSGLALLNNLGILNILTNQQLDIPIYARFRSKGEAISYFKDRKKELLRLVVCYYILFADDKLEGRSVDEIPNGEPRVTDEDIVRALVGKLKDTIGLKLSQREEEFLFAYMTGMWMNRSGWVSRTVERLDEGIREKLEGKIAAKLESASSTKRPGVLYFDLDKILEADPIPAAMYVDLLERLSDVENYAVVIVNSYPDKSINQLLGKFPGLAKRLQRIMRKGIVLDAHRLEIGSGPGIGQRLIEEAIRLAKAKLKADEIPPENITLAIYAPNRWLYPEEFLRNFAVVIMSAKTIRLDEQQLRELEKFLPGIGRLVADNRMHLLTEELLRLREELDRLEEAEVVSSQA